MVTKHNESATLEIELASLTISSIMLSSEAILCDVHIPKKKLKKDRVISVRIKKIFLFLYLLKLLHIVFKIFK